MAAFFRHRKPGRSKALSYFQLPNVPTLPPSPLIVYKRRQTHIEHP